MKLRNGFVSNSSSSSFMVSIKKNGKVSETVGTLVIKKQINLKNYIELTISTAEDLYDYFLDNFGDRDEWHDDLIKEYKLALKEIANGKYIAVGSFSDQDEYEERMLCEEGLKGLISENITVIQSEAGY